MGGLSGLPGGHPLKIYIPEFFPFNIVSLEILQAAQESPEDYQDLILKVDGDVTYFSRLGKDELVSIIACTEHGA